MRPAPPGRRSYQHPSHRSNRGQLRRYSPAIISLGVDFRSVLEPDPKSELSTSYQQGKLLTVNASAQRPPRRNKFSTFSTSFSAVAWLPKWHFGSGVIEFRVLRAGAARNGLGRGLGCPRLISGVVGPYLGGRSQAGGQRRKRARGTGRQKTWLATTFWASGCSMKPRGDRIFSVGGANLWFAPGCGNRTSTRRPVLRFGDACGALLYRGKLW